MFVCEVCHKLAQGSCAKCHAHYYCSEACLEKSKHKKLCKGEKEGAGPVSSDSENDASVEAPHIGMRVQEVIYRDFANVEVSKPLSDAQKRDLIGEEDPRLEYLLDTRIKIFNVKYRGTKEFQEDPDHVLLLKNGIYISTTAPDWGKQFLRLALSYTSYEEIKRDMDNVNYVDDIVGKYTNLTLDKARKLYMNLEGQISESRKLMNIVEKVQEKYL